MDIPSTQTKTERNIEDIPQGDTDQDNPSTKTESQDLHFSHEHPLILCDQRSYDTGGAPCYCCLLPLLGRLAYVCNQCRFILHKVCAELPNKIIHFLHPKHPLTLFPKTPYSGPPTCENCHVTIWGYDYHCSLCKYDLCIQCVLLHQIVEHEGHEHSFIPHRPTSFTCDACGKIGSDISYTCSTCHLWVHKTCASLPPTIKHIGHDHPLSLIHSVQLNDPMVDSLCKACGEDVDPCYWCYYCASCRYIAHLDCATLEAKLGDELNELGSAFISVPNECTEISLTKIERVTELQHISHRHSLTLSNDEPDSEEVCDGCVQTISAPFYKCAQCNFFLHVSCAELPDRIQHLLHPHSLTLFAIHSLNFDKFYCGACYQHFNGFAYGCKNCNFYIDVRCTSVSGILRHAAHEHTLSLYQKISKSDCNACGVSCSTRFRCEACDFNLDLRCAALPSSMRYKWDKHHPLKLTFSIIEDKLRTHYCDFCEEPRDDPNHWFYYCEDCDVEVHPLCLLGKNMMIKFGKSFESGVCPHLVTLVKNTRLPHRSGHNCDHEKGKKTVAFISKDDMLLLECADCNVHDHTYICENSLGYSI